MSESLLSDDNEKSFIKLHIIDQNTCDTSREMNYDINLKDQLKVWDKEKNSTLAYNKMIFSDNFLFVILIFYWNKFDP